MSDDGTMRPWITERICEALDQADLARLTASDLDDHVLIPATVRLAEDLEAFALSLAARLSEIGEVPRRADRAARRRGSSLQGHLPDCPLT